MSCLSNAVTATWTFQKIQKRYVDTRAALNERFLCILLDQKAQSPWSEHLGIAVTGRRLDAILKRFCFPSLMSDWICTISVPEGDGRIIRLPGSR